MKNIEVKVLNPEQLQQGEQMMVAMARLTQRSHKITNMHDFMTLLTMPYSNKTVEAMARLPHPTIQKFSLINIAIVGASRRFLAQITRHQNEIKFMSGSLQYSDYSTDAQFCVPYEVTRAQAQGAEVNGQPVLDYYLAGCRRDLEEYRQLTQVVGNDAAGYKMPQGMRNVLLMSVLPFELMHIINQRTCNRNTLETQYVLLKIWEQLYWHPEYSGMWKNCGPDCQSRGCQEGKFTCGNPLGAMTPTDILKQEFPLIYRRDF